MSWLKDWVDVRKAADIMLREVSGAVGCSALSCLGVPRKMGMAGSSSSYGQGNVTLLGSRSERIEQLCLLADSIIVNWDNARVKGGENRNG
jgi:hypothetical protein